MLFERTEYDKFIYESQLKDYLPKNMIDIHTHVYRDQDRLVPRKIIRWPALVAKDNPIEDLIETYKIMFPDKNVKALMFAGTQQDTESRKRMNEYVSLVSKQHDFPALYFSHPTQSADELERNIIAGGFLGIKSYLSFADPSIPRSEVRIFDFIPHHQLEKLDQMGAIVMCHIARDLRFKDPQNLADLKEIATKYKNLKFIVAHIGRAYIPSDMGNALEYLSDCTNLLYDFCANTSAENMEAALRSVGTKRLFFGSDLPILRMRMRRIERNGTYVNLVPPKMYGDISFDPHMDEVSEEEGKNLTYFMYEEILAMKKATTNIGLGKDDVEDLFYNNAKELIDGVRKNIYGK